jgi:hypothetical protein
LKRLKSFGSAATIPGNKHTDVKSFASPAKQGWNPSVEFGCLVGSDKKGTPLRPYAQQLLHSAMESGFAGEHAALNKHLEDGLKGELTKRGAVIK